MTGLRTRFFLGYLSLVLIATGSVQAHVVPAKSVTIVTPAAAHVRVNFGATHLAKALKSQGYQVKMIHQMPAGAGTSTIVIGRVQDAMLKSAFLKNKIKLSSQPGKEGFAISPAKNNLLIAGADNSGTLYGCIELADRIKATGKLPVGLNMVDKPEMVMRGACVGVQKPVLLEGRGTYEYPYTPENFPILRYSDVLLMLAEAENEVNGPTTVAYDAINQVRRRAYGLTSLTTPNATADLPAGLDYDRFGDALREERARELCFEGLRRNDLIRWGLFLTTMKAVAAQFAADSPTAYGVLGYNNVAARNVLLPIPSAEMSVNRAITQNPGW